MPKTGRPKNRRRKDRARKAADQQKLITYLGARTSHRFDGKRPLPHAVTQHRLSLLVLLTFIVLAAAWGMWRDEAAQRQR